MRKTSKTSNSFRDLTISEVQNHLRGSNFYSIVHLCSVHSLFHSTLIPGTRHPRAPHPHLPPLPDASALRLQLQITVAARREVFLDRSGLKSDQTRADRTKPDRRIKQEPPGAEPSHTRCANNWSKPICQTGQTGTCRTTSDKKWPWRYQFSWGKMGAAAGCRERTYPNTNSSKNGAGGTTHIGSLTWPVNPLIDKARCLGPPLVSGKTPPHGGPDPHQETPCRSNVRTSNPSQTQTGSD